MAAASIAPFWLTSGAWGAQTVTISLTLGFTPAGVSNLSATSRTSGTLALAGNLAAYFQGLQTIASGSLQAVQLGNVTTLGYMLLHNANPTTANPDTTAYLSIFSDSAGSSELARLYPGDWAMIPLAPSAHPYAEASSGNINLETYVVGR